MGSWVMFRVLDFSSQLQLRIVRDHKPNGAIKPHCIVNLTILAPGRKQVREVLSSELLVAGKRS